MALCPPDECWKNIIYRICGIGTTDEILPEHNREEDKGMNEKEYLPELVKKAIDAKELAYAPYSNFKVGACVLASDGTMVTGANIENASFGLTICAERVALFRSYAEGKRDIAALAVSADTPEPVSPCGACRQVISELAADAKVCLSNHDGSKVKVMTSEELLPYGFKL